MEPLHTRYVAGHVSVSDCVGSFIALVMDLVTCNVHFSSSYRVGLFSLCAVVI